MTTTSPDQENDNVKNDNVKEDHHVAKNANNDNDANQLTNNNNNNNKEEEEGKVSKGEKGKEKAHTVPKVNVEEGKEKEMKLETVETEEENENEVKEEDMPVEEVKASKEEVEAAKEDEKEKKDVNEQNKEKEGEEKETAQNDEVKEQEMKEEDEEAAAAKDEMNIVNEKEKENGMEQIGEKETGSDEPCDKNEHDHDGDDGANENEKETDSDDDDDFFERLQWAGHGHSKSQRKRQRKAKRLLSNPIKKVSISIPSLLVPTIMTTTSSMSSRKRPRDEEPDDNKQVVPEPQDDFSDSWTGPRLFQTPLCPPPSSETTKHHRLEEELENSLAFYQDTHEEQDPAFWRYQQQVQQAKLAKQLEIIDAEFQTGRKEIDEFITDQMKQRQVQHEQKLDILIKQAHADEKRDLERLQQLYQQKTASNMKKINQALNMLRLRHQQEIDVAMQQQRHRASQQQPPLTPAQQQQQWQQVSQAILGKQQRQIQELTAKGEQAKKKTEADYKRQQEKLRKKREDTTRELEANRQALSAKLMSNAQLTRQRYLKRHMQRIMKKKEECLAEMKMNHRRSASDEQTVIPSIETSSDKHQATKSPSSHSTTDASRDVSQAALDDKVELRQPSPIKTTPEWAVDLPERAGAPSRHKHRKAIMSQTSRQIAVEIHNEGLWVSVLGNSTQRGTGGGSPSSLDDVQTSGGEGAAKSDDGQHHHQPRQHVEEEFIPWGSRAHSVLESIVSGEIPAGYERFDYGEYQIMQGGQIRCSLSDLRTAETTAARQRAESARELEETNLADLESKAAKLTQMAFEAEKASAKAEEEEKANAAALEAVIKELEKFKRVQEEFTTKFKNYIGPGKV